MAYHASAVHFDGTNSLLIPALVSPDCFSATASGWFKLSSANATQETFFAADPTNNQNQFCSLRRGWENFAGTDRHGTGSEQIPADLV